MKLNPENSKKIEKPPKAEKKQKKFFKQLDVDIYAAKNGNKINKGEFFNKDESEYETGKYKNKNGTKKQAEKEENLTEEEKEEIKTFKEWGIKFWEKVEKESNWNGFSDQQKKDALKIMTEVFLKISIEEDAELIKNKAEKLSQKITLNIIREK